MCSLISVLPSVHLGIDKNAPGEGLWEAPAGWSWRWPGGPGGWNGLVG